MPPVLTLNRRRFLALGAAALVPAAAQPSRQGTAGCGARPGTPTATIAAGEHPLGLASDRDGLLRIPARYRPDTPAPLAVLLHGAGGHARRIVSLLGVADSLGVIVLAPESRGGSTWDAIRGGFGPTSTSSAAPSRTRSRAAPWTRAGSRSAASPTAPATRSRWA